MHRKKIELYRIEVPKFRNPGVIKLFLQAFLVSCIGLHNLTANFEIPPAPFCSILYDRSLREKHVNQSGKSNQGET